MAEIRNTMQRELILQSLCEMKNHPTAEDVYVYVRKRHKNISRNTVYRNLKILSETGKIKKVGIASGADIFDFNTTEHYHIKCSKCGKVEDINADIADLSIEVEGYDVLGYDLIYSGVCPICKYIFGGLKNG